MEGVFVVAAAAVVVVVVVVVVGVETEGEGRVVGERCNATPSGCTVADLNVVPSNKVPPRARKRVRAWAMSCFGDTPKD